VWAGASARIDDVVGDEFLGGDDVEGQHASRSNPEVRGPVVVTAEDERGLQGLDDLGIRAARVGFQWAHRFRGLSWR
jgi:hypothetical protein